MDARCGERYFYCPKTAVVGTGSQEFAAFVVMEAGELIAFQAARALEGDAGRFVAAGGDAEELGDGGAELRKGERRDRFFSPTARVD